MKRIELLLISIIGFAAVTASMFQTFFYIRATPAGKVYPLVHNYPQDYYYYLSYIKQGMEGKVFITSRFSPEKRPYMFIYTFFPLTGQVLRIFTGRPDIAYTVSRIFWGTAMIISAYLFGSRVLNKFGQRITYLLILIFHAPLWRITGGKIIQEGEFWTGFDPVMKLSFLPHHMAAVTIMIWAVILFIHALEKKSNILNIFSGMLFLTASFVNTAVFLATVPALIFLLAASLKTDRNYFFRYLLFLVFPLPGLLLMSSVMKSSFPWNIFAGWERNSFYPIDLAMLVKSLGIISILGLVSLPRVMKEKNRHLAFSAGMFITPFLLVYFMTGKIPVSNIRFVQSGQYIFAGLLTVFMMSSLTKRIKKKPFRIAFITVSVLFFSLQYIPSVYSSVIRQMEYIKGNKYNNLIYPDQSFFGLLGRLDKTGDQDEVVLANPALSPLVPAFTNKKVVYGHPILTENPGEKTSDCIKYLTADNQKIREELEGKYDIKYVITRTDDNSYDPEKTVFSEGDYKLIRTGR